MPLNFDIQLLERDADRFSLSVSLCAGAEVPELERVTVELRAPGGARLSPRLVLPVRGPLSERLSTPVDLEAHLPVPPGAYIMGVAWTAEGAVETRCPTDELVGLEAHVMGRKVLLPEDPIEELESLTEEDLTALLARLPGLRDAVSCEREEGGHLDPLGPDLVRELFGASWEE
ncbi:MAG: hypothetical protein JXX28_06925 [Deltaproteobacteria bacterium]|nr:hypothetical protein [Deltaproteobacteria bacterium]